MYLYDNPFAHQSINLDGFQGIQKIADFAQGYAQGFEPLFHSAPLPPHLLLAEVIIFIFIAWFLGKVLEVF